MSDEERDLEMDSAEDEIDVGTNETDSMGLNYNAVAGIQNDHHFGNFAIPSQINSQFMSDADRKRAHHNALERKRRDHIKDSFHTLRDAIPNIKGEKTSRAQILKAATEYIRLMRNRNNDYAKDIELLKKQNNDIETQIRQLEKARAASHYARHASNELIQQQQHQQSLSILNENQTATSSSGQHHQTSSSSSTTSSNNDQCNENMFLKPKRFKHVLGTKTQNEYS